MWQFPRVGAGVPGVFFLTEREIGMFICIFSVWKGSCRISWFASVWVSHRTRILSHTLHNGIMRFSDVSPGVGMRHPTSPKNSGGLNLRIHISVHVLTYDLGSGMQSGLANFLNLFFWKRKAKDVSVNAIPRFQIQLDLSIWANHNRP